jgi:hypothetical protein
MRPGQESGRRYKPGDFQKLCDNVSYCSPGKTTRPVIRQPPMRYHMVRTNVTVFRKRSAEASTPAAIVQYPYVHLKMHSDSRSLSTQLKTRLRAVTAEYIVFDADTGRK